MVLQSINEFIDLFEEINDWEKHSLPLCAAENITSDFVKLPHSSFLQEKYVLGGVIEYQTDENFVGSNNLYRIYEALHNQCKKMYGCKFADGRTLSGLNAITTLAMAMFAIGDKVMITIPEYGGHSSIPVIFERLGIETIPLPYDYAINDFDYSNINKLLATGTIKGIVIALSDTIEHPELWRLNLKDEVLLYDATQLLGLIAVDYIANPLNWFKDDKNFVLLGATHKTIPGPTCGLIMTNNLNLAKLIDLKINPAYIRNVQLNNVVSLLFSLYELESFGKEYFDTMKIILNTTAKTLEDAGIKVVHTRAGTDYSNTHQLWISLQERETDILWQNAKISGVSLNVRKRRIYTDCGVRLGFQQVARYKWGVEEAKKISQILLLLKEDPCDFNQIKTLMDGFPLKKIHFTFSDYIKNCMSKALHNSDKH